MNLKQIAVLVLQGKDFYIYVLIIFSWKNHKDSRSLMFVERKANNHSLSARFVKPMPKSMIDSFLSNHEENHISKIETVYQKKWKRINECKENKSIKKKPKNYRVVINL